MHTLRLFDKEAAPKSVLLLGAHCDDIEIGCGATILRLLRHHPDLSVTWVVFSSNPVREQEARASAQAFLEGCGSADVRVENFRNGYFPWVGAEIKDYFEALKADVAPDIVFTHYGKDLHQDHRTVSELTWNTFRDHMILEYEIPKYDGGLGSPGLFVPVDRDEVERKTGFLDRYYQTQKTRSWFSASTFEGLMRLRGIECNAPDGYAEAFYCRKLVVTWDGAVSGRAPCQQAR